MDRTTPHIPSPAARRPRRAAGGMTLVETMLAGVGIAAVLGTLVLVNGSLRADTAETQTRRTLARLGAALSAYERDHAGAPAGPTANALTVLLGHGPSAAALEPLVLRQGPGGEPRVLDGFGTPVRYHPPSAEHDTAAEFVSAGPDRVFGDPFAAADARRPAADNIHGADLEAAR